MIGHLSWAYECVHVYDRCAALQVTWVEIQPSAIRGGSGAILPLPPNMLPGANRVTAIAFGGGGGGIAFWTSKDPGQVDWDPPVGCKDAGPVLLSEEDSTCSCLTMF